MLVLGSADAGLLGALHAKVAAHDLDVTVAAKGLLGKSGCTRMVQGRCNVTLAPGDSAERHGMDSIEAAAGSPTRISPGRTSPSPSAAPGNSRPAVAAAVKRRFAAGGRAAG